MSDDQQKYLDVGMNDFLSKPFTLAQLKAIFKRWLTVSRKNNNILKTFISSDKENITTSNPILHIENWRHCAN